MNHFILDGRYEDLLSHYKFNVEEALKKANIPEDCFKKLQLKLQLQIQLNLSPHQFLRHIVAVTEIFLSSV